MNLLQQFVDFLLNQKNKPSLLTVKNYKADAGQFINWFEKKFNLPLNPSSVTTQTLCDYKKTRNLSESSIKRHICSLRKFFNFLKMQGVIFQDPLERKTVPAESLAKEDPWMIKNFKSFLYEYKKSNLTIKNYINDLKGFFLWLDEVILIKHGAVMEDKSLLSTITSPVIEEYKQRLIAAKFSPATISRKLSSLRSYLGWAKRQGLASSTATEPLPADSEYEHLQAKTSTSQPTNIRSEASKQADEISNIKKEFYAPIDISSVHLPMHKIIWRFINHTRPNWYKKYHSYSFSHYLHFTIFATIGCAIGFGLYGYIFANLHGGKELPEVYGGITTASLNRSTQALQELGLSTTGLIAKSDLKTNDSKSVGFTQSMEKSATHIASATDFTELFRKDNSQMIEFGSVMCLGERGLTVRCDRGNSKVIGVASGHTVFSEEKNLKDDSIIVVLIGQANTLVTVSNEEIKAGDMLTVSDIPGIAKKTTTSGQIIGRALKNLTHNEDCVVGYFNPDTMEYRSKDNLPNVPLKPSIIRIYRLPILVGVSWYDPNVYFNQSGQLVKDSQTSNINAINTQTFWESLKDHTFNMVNKLWIKNEELKIISPIIETQ